MALIIAGERSGVGKTTITLALLAFLAQKSSKVQSFKVGPDYIDPMFHSAVTGLPCRNLDPLLTSEAYIPKCFNYHCHNKNYALVEGVMGLFDGVKFGSITDFASTAHIARLLELPVVLVLDCRRLSGSVAAITQGFINFDPKVKLAGVFLNKVGSDRHLELLQEALDPLNLPVMGVLRRHEDITIPDRHLGLVPTAELPEFKKIVHLLATLAGRCFDWEVLLPLLKPNKSSFISPYLPYSKVDKKMRIALAWDKAFNFYYQDNLDIFENLGAELIPWSPLKDSHLPEEIQGCYFGGGFPEIFATELTENKQIFKLIKIAIKNGLPIYAECGGLMYLSQQIVDFEGKSWPMVGVLPTGIAMGKSLIIGYRKAKALQHSPIIQKGKVLWGHEFHRSQVTSPLKQSLWEMRTLNTKTKVIFEGWYNANLHASYLHLHFGSNTELVTRFLHKCNDYSSYLKEWISI